MLLNGAGGYPRVRTNYKGPSALITRLIFVTLLLSKGTLDGGGTGIVGSGSMLENKGNQYVSKRLNNS